LLVQPVPVPGRTIRTFRRTRPKAASEARLEPLQSQFQPLIQTQVQASPVGTRAQPQQSCADPPAGSLSSSSDDEYALCESEEVATDEATIVHTSLETSLEPAPAPEHAEEPAAAKAQELEAHRDQQKAKAAAAKANASAATPAAAPKSEAARPVPGRKIRTFRRTTPKTKTKAEVEAAARQAAEAEAAARQVQAAKEAAAQQAAAEVRAYGRCLAAPRF
jgi:hypothetical protein